MPHKCGACFTPVTHNVNGLVYQPLGIVTAWCNPCIRKYDTLRYSCSGCKELFDPNEEGIVGETLRYCGECCDTLDADESVIDDMADKVANGCPVMEA